MKEKEIVKPILKYVGSKNWFIKYHKDLLPKSVENYYEPFLGSASIFFYLKSQQIIKRESRLSDINNNLISLYVDVKEGPGEIIAKMKVLKQTKQTYYNIRTKFNSEESAGKSVHFLYLNKLCFRGIYRVNKNGDYNVPYGNRSYKKIIDDKHLMNVHSSLKCNTKLINSDFKGLSYPLKKGDFICLDPPYIDNSSVFNRYDSQSFVEKDTNFLIQIIKKAHSKKAKFLLFVGDNYDFAKTICRFGKITKLERNNMMSSHNKGVTRKEYILKNY